MQAKDKITKARAGLILDAPFFGSLALRIKLQEDPACKTAWIDGKSMGYNPAFIESLTLEETKAVLAHEVMHVAACHHTRRQDRDPAKWNTAADAAINQALTDAGFRLPTGHIPGENDSAEAIYSRMPDPPTQDNAQQGEGDGGSGQGSPSPGNQDPGDEDQDGDQGSPGDGDQDQPDNNPDPGGCGEVRDYPGDGDGPATPAEMAQAEAEAKVATAQAAQMAKAQGKLPGSLARMVEEILEPRADWREILSRFIEQSAKNDYSWSHPNRRYIHAGLYLPGLHSQEIGAIAIAVDTSSSVSARDLAGFAAEISGILDAYDTRAQVIYCDTEIERTEEFTKQDLPLILNPTGGGGTDFRPPFTWIEENADQTPACLVYLTDGECSRYPDQTPDYPVLWALTQSNSRFSPPFGEVIEIN